MALFDNFSGINIASGFKLQAKAPLDPRLVVNTIADRNALIAENGAYEGMQVYVKTDKKTYCLKDLVTPTWEEIVNGSDMEALENRTSALENAGFVTNAVNDLINYYAKKETYTKDEVNRLISRFSTLSFTIVDTLPETGESDKIYLVHKEGSYLDVYDEYIYIEGAFERIGTTQIDLSNYYTKEEINNLLKDYVVNARTIAGLSLKSDITAEQLRGALSLKEFKELGAFSIAVSDWQTLLNAEPYTAQAVKTITFAEGIAPIDENCSLFFSFDDIVASTGIVVASATGTNALLVTFYAVETPTKYVTGTVGGVV